MAQENHLFESEFGAFWEWLTIWKVLIILNAIGGLYLFEKAWYTSRRFRKPIQELDAQFPELCRPDAPKWQKWKHYPGALTLLIPRMIWCALLMIIMAIMANVFLICHDRRKAITGCRKFLCKMLIKLCVNLICLGGCFTYMGYKYISLEEVNFYEEYLGSVEE